MGGSRYDRSGPIEVVSQPLGEVHRDESFPFFEDRSVRPDPLQLRHTFPVQAFGCKATVGLEEKTEKEDYVILFEVLLDQFTVSFDSAAWVRFLRFLSNSRHGGFDERWHTGDWTDMLTLDMLLRPSEPLILENHLQHVAPTFLDENDLPSSEFLNANVKLRGILVRLPSAIHKESRSCDIVLKIDQSTLVVSSSLPVHLMQNTLRSSDVQFPQSRSDQVHSHSVTFNDSAYSSNLSTIFRAQSSCTGLSIQLSPALGFLETKADDSILLPCSIDMAVGFEGNVQSDDPECDSIELSLVVSMISTELQLRINADRLFSAACTVRAHAEACIRFMEELNQVKTQSGAAENQKAKINDSGMLQNTMAGRRILVQKQIKRGRQSSGFRIALWYVVDCFAASMWRRNVPRANPLKGAQDATSEIIHEICLFECLVSGGDFGIEYSGLPTHSGILVKCAVDNLDLKVAHFIDMLSNDRLWQKVFNSSQALQIQNVVLPSEYMLSFLRFGFENEVKRPSIRFRCQFELTGQSKAGSAALEMESGTVIVAFESVMVTFLLIAEALVSLAGMADPLELSLLSSTGPFRQMFPKARDKAGEGMGISLVSIGDFILCRICIRNTDFQIEPSHRLDRGSDYTLHLDECGAFLNFDKLAGFDSSLLMQSIATSGNECWSDVISNEESKRGLAMSSTCCFVLKHVTDEVNVLSTKLKATFDGVEADIAFLDGVRIHSVDHLNGFIHGLDVLSAESTAVADDLWTALSTLFLSFNKDEYDKRDSENPVNLACRSAVSSIQSVKRWLQTVNHAMSVSTTRITDLFEKKQLELDALQLMIFSKEKERVSSLARNEPEMAGWLRIGAARRTGQRGLLSGTLLPHWAILRKSILFLFEDPSYVRCNGVFTLLVRNSLSFETDHA